MPGKRTIDSFFSNRSEPSQKKAKLGADIHKAYPVEIQWLPADLALGIADCPSTSGTEQKDQPDLDLLTYTPYLPLKTSKRLFEFLREELPFYRVQYSITRYGNVTSINTPRYTTVFGVDETSFFDDSGELHDTKTSDRLQSSRYKSCVPRPIPSCLDELRKSTEKATGCLFNFCLVNYYASGTDSISYHSDDESFLGDLPAIASFSLGASRDFLMKHKPPRPGKPEIEASPLKFHLQSGSLILMRGPTQENWLHSIPKRAHSVVTGGRINITFRKALVPAGTENYYRYNVGTGPVYKWNSDAKEMKLLVKS